MSLEQDIRAEIENIKKLKMEVGNINNHLSALEGMCREHNQKAVDDAYKRGYEDGKNSIDKGCEGCKFESRTEMEEPCKYCSNCHTSKYTPMPKEDDRIEVGDEVVFETEGAEPFVILHKYYDDAGYPSEYRYFVYAQNGEVLMFNECNGPKKTGRHFQETNKLLEAMRK